MEKLLIWICTAIFFLPPETNSLEGRWKRIDDEWEGMLIDVVQSAEGYTGTLGYVPSPAFDWGFRKGDAKWKVGKIEDKTRFYFLDLYMTQGSQHQYYKNSIMWFSAPDTLETVLVKYENEYIGRVQRWVRIPVQVSQAYTPTSRWASHP